MKRSPKKIPGLKILEAGELRIESAEDSRLNVRAKGKRWQGVKIALCQPLTDPGSLGLMLNADGKASMAEIWGKRSNWVDYTATVDGEALGVAIFDHPSNPRYPTYWHARDYGLFALNPFGQKAFDPTKEESAWKIASGQKIEFRWQVVVHPADAPLADLYKQYAAKK